MISVQLTDEAPAAFRMTLRDRLGSEIPLERSDPYLVEAEEDAFERILARGERLPAGAIEVLVEADPLLRDFPTSSEVGQAIAARAA